jgi:hypothetical protein
MAKYLAVAGAFCKNAGHHANPIDDYKRNLGVKILKNHQGCCAADMICTCVASK